MESGCLVILTRWTLSCLSVNEASFEDLGSRDVAKTMELGRSRN